MLVEKSKSLSLDELKALPALDLARMTQQELETHFGQLLAVDMEGDLAEEYETILNGLLR